MNIFSILHNIEKIAQTAKIWTKPEWEAYKKLHPGTKIKPKFEQQEKSEDVTKNTLHEKNRKHDPELDKDLYHYSMGGSMMDKADWEKGGAYDFNDELKSEHGSFDDITDLLDLNNKEKYSSGIKKVKNLFKDNPQKYNHFKNHLKNWVKDNPKKLKTLKDKNIEIGTHNLMSLIGGAIYFPDKVDTAFSLLGKSLGILDKDVEIPSNLSTKVRNKHNEFMNEKSVQKNVHPTGVKLKSFPKEIADRKKALSNLVSDIKDEAQKDKVMRHMKEPLLGDYGVTTKHDLLDVIDELKSGNHKFSLEKLDVGNLKAVNDKRQSHELANKDLQTVLGGVLAKGITDAGGIIGRTGGDEFAVVWPYSPQEATKIRNHIEEKVRAKRDELGYSDVAHARNKLPTGAIHTNFGIIPGEGDYGEMDAKADRLAERNRLRDELELAEKLGYGYNAQTKNYEKAA